MEMHVVPRGGESRFLMKPFRGKVMSMKIVVGFFLFCVCGLGLAQVNALPSTRHILVYGSAQARAIPDRFKLEIEFEVVDPDADRARRKVEDYVKDAIDKLEASSVPASEIVATGLNIEPRERYDQDQRKQVYEGVGVTRKVSARFPNHAGLEKFLASLKASAEVKISGVTTGLGDEQALNRELRKKAIESTRQKAAAIAGSYGVRLAGLYSVSDVAPQFEYGIREGDWPELYQWSRDDGGSTSLDRIEVTGSRIERSDMESFRTGYVTFEDRIYAVFLIED